jgi:hypothetical protein
MSRMMGVTVVLVLVLVAGCTGGGEETTTSTSPPTTTAPSPTTTGPSVFDFRPRQVAPFAELEAIPLVASGDPYPGPQLPSSLDGVIRQPWTVPSEQAAARLLENGFVVIPGREALFHTLYKSYEAEQVWFVTTDVGYHFWHLAFDKVLREVETQTLLPALEQLVTGMLSAARSQSAELTGTDLADPADRVEQLFEATATLLELDVGPIGPLARQEVELALEAIEKTESPITSFGSCDVALSPADCVDYSLFLPRGHYTRSPELERYFRAMSMLGQASFFLGEPDKEAWDERSLQLGLLATRLFGFDPELGDQWATVYEPTAFLVGAADDFTPFELASAAEDLTPGVMSDPTLATPDVLRQIARTLQASRPVLIDAQAAAVRVMGARFVIDAFVLDQMVRPYVGTLDDPRWLASPLDLAATLGSDLAYRIQDEAGETHYANYDAQLEAMTGVIAGRTADDWGATVYDAWLYALEPKFVERTSRYPEMMRTPAWTAKDLQSALGSYAELKHDTILYAKQSSAAEGGYELLAEPARHWVEPDPVAFGRLTAAARMLHEGLASRGLLPTEVDRLLADLEDTLDRFARLAGDELEGLPISKEDNDWLTSIGSVLEALWYQSADTDGSVGGMPAPEDMDSALIADIQSSPDDYLEIGTGWVDRILVLVPNDNGHFQVAEGAVYSYYEFAWPRTEQRLTDDEWRAMLAAGEQPDRPGWQLSFLPPATGGEGSLDLPSGLMCVDLSAAGFPYPSAVGYWLREDRPQRMDADGNGIPCETVYESWEIDGLIPAPDQFASGLMCRDLADQGAAFSAAVGYWLAEGMPDRMDSDRNGIPCETVYDPAEVGGFLWFERG